MVQPGDVLVGRYHVLASLGRGGMADVYLAVDAERQVRVAIKVLRADLAEEPEFVRRFSREAEALAKLEHPHIARSYSFESANTLAFIVLEYVAGGTLRARLRDAGGPLPMVEVGRLLRQIATALHYAHRRGFVHRDIKPANIMYREDGTALLTDFGIARAMETATATFAEAGTPAYMSPEQVLGHPLDGRSDIYSLGVVIYEAVTGVRPFRGEYGSGATTPRRIQDEHVRLPPPDPRALRLSLPTEAAAVIMRALAKQPGERWADAIDMANAWDAATAGPLDAGTAGAPGDAVAASQPHPSPGANRPRKTTRQRRRVMAGVAAAGGLVLVASGAGYMAYRRLGIGVQPAPTAAASSTHAAPTATATPDSGRRDAAGYEDEWGVLTVKRGSALHLGVTLGAGVAASVGESLANGVAIAVADHGPVHDCPVELLRQDDDCSVERSTQIAARLCASANLLAVIGHACPDGTGAALPIYEWRHGLLVSPSSSWAQLTTNGSLTFNRVCRNDSAHSRAMARFLREELRLDRLALARDGTGGSPGITSESANAWKELGGVVVFEGDMLEGSDAAAGLIRSAKLAGAQALCCAGEASRVALYARSRFAAEAADIHFVATHLADNRAFVDEAGYAANGAYLTSEMTTGDRDALAAFVTAYSRRYGAAPDVESLSAYAYDAAMLVLRAADAVALVDATGSVLVGRKALAVAVRETSGHAGLTGVLACDSHGDCAGAAIRVMRVVNGELAPVWTLPG